MTSVALWWLRTYLIGWFGFNLGSGYFAVDGNLPSETICRELFVIGQSKWRTKHVTFGRFWLVNFKNQFKKFCTPRSLSPTLYTPFQCTLPHTFTYWACPFGVHCLSFNALPAEIRIRNHGILRPAHYPLHHSVTGVIVANTAI